MKKLFALLALAATVLPSGVLAREPAQRFTHEGTTFVYTTSEDSRGRTVIQGRRLPGASAFRLVVDGRRVDGVWGGQPVSFRAPQGGAVVVAAR